MDNLSAFEPVDRLTGLVGLVAQAGASLEASLHSLHAELAGGSGEPGHVLHKYVSGVASLIEQCAEMLWQSALPQDQQEHAIAALTDARVANQRRNDVVHGAWFWLDYEHVEAWSHKLRKGPVSVNLTEDEVLRLAADLQRVTIRIEALLGLLHRAPFGPPASSEEAWSNDLEELLATIRGEFDLVGPDAWQMRQ